MLKIMCPANNVYDIKVIDVESGVDLTKQITNIQLKIEDRHWVAVITFRNVIVDSSTGSTSREA